ncbi:MAG: DUF503 domain-containing protein [Actinomycetota bacterium]
MIVGIMVVRLRLPEAGSLKDKRHTVKSLLNRAKSRYGVAVSEVDEHDTWQRTKLGFSTVAGTEFQARKVLNALENDILTHHSAELIEVRRKFVGMEEDR